MPTKAQLEFELQKLKHQIKLNTEQFSDKIGAVNATVVKLNEDIRRLRNDSDRHEGNFRQADGKLKSISRVILSTLEVAYQTGPEEEYSGEVKTEKTLPVRFLRHLFKLADTSVPF